MLFRNGDVESSSGYSRFTTRLFLVNQLPYCQKSRAQPAGMLKPPVLLSHLTKMLSSAQRCHFMRYGDTCAGYQAIHHYCACGSGEAQWISEAAFNGFFLVMDRRSWPCQHQRATSWRRQCLAGSNCHRDCSLPGIRPRSRCAWEIARTAIDRQILFRSLADSEAFSETRIRAMEDRHHW